MLSNCSNYWPESLHCEDELFAYLDDSVSSDGTLVCSAGYLFEAAMARKFRKVWKPFLDSKQIEYFHATEHIRRRDAEEIFSKLAQLIKETAIRGFVNLLDSAILKSIDKSIRPYLGSAFSYSTLACMHMMGEAAKEHNKTVIYFIENGHRFDKELRHFLRQIQEIPQQKENYAMVVADTVNKRDVIQLQAADLFAWSFTRSHSRRSWVPSIRELVQDRVLRHTMQRFDPLMLSLVHSFYGMRSNRKNFE